MICNAARPSLTSELLTNIPTSSGALSSASFIFTLKSKWYKDLAGEENTSIFFHNPNVLVTVSKGMWAVKLCFNKILQFLIGGGVPAVLYNGCKTAAVVVAAAAAAVA